MISVIIPICKLNDDEDRKNAFLTVLSRVRDHIPEDIIVVEQVESISSKRFDDYDKSGIHHIKYVNNGAINRSGMRNHGIQFANFDVVLFLDADVIVNFRDVKKEAESLKRGIVVRPYSEIERLTQSETESVHNRSGVPRDGSHRQKFSLLSAAALLINKYDFIESRGYDESFEDWGFEDCEYRDRLEFLYTIKSIDSKGYHLWHSKAVLKVKNKNRYKDMRHMRCQDRFDSVKSPFPKIVVERAFANSRISLTASPDQSYVSYLNKVSKPIGDKNRTNTIVW